MGVVKAAGPIRYTCPSENVPILASSLVLGKLNLMVRVSQGLLLLAIDCSIYSISFKAGSSFELLLWHQSDSQINELALLSLDFLVMTDESGRLTLISTKNPRCAVVVWQGEDAVWSLGCCQHNRIVFGSNDHKVRCFSLHSMQAEVIGEHQHNVPGVAITYHSSLKDYLIASASIDSFIQICRVASPLQPLAMTRLGSWAWSVAWLDLSLGIAKPDLLTEQSKCIYTSLHGDNGGPCLHLLDDQTLSEAMAITEEGAGPVPPASSAIMYFDVADPEAFSGMSFWASDNHDPLNWSRLAEHRPVDIADFWENVESETQDQSETALNDPMDQECADDDASIETDLWKERRLDGGFSDSDDHLNSDFRLLACTLVKSLFIFAVDVDGCQMHTLLEIPNLIPQTDGLHHHYHHERLQWPSMCRFFRVQQIPGMPACLLCVNQCGCICAVQLVQRDAKDLHARVLHIPGASPIIGFEVSSHRWGSADVLVTHSDLSICRWSLGL